MGGILGKTQRIYKTGGVILTGILVLFILLNVRNLSLGVWSGSIATGLCYALVAIGVYITFRVLDFPDLTIDGSFPLGASVAAAMIAAGVNPYITLPVAFFAGALAGMATAVIANRLKIHSLLASILTTTALVSINLRIMGKSNIPLLDSITVFTPYADGFRRTLERLGNPDIMKIANNLLAILIVGLLVVFIKLLFDWTMLTELGLALQATGANQQMIRSLGGNTSRMIVLGLALSNGLVGFSGALFAQYQGFSDVNMGQGLIIAGLAAVIVGETLFRPGSIPRATLSVILGMILYRIAIAAALNVKIPLPGGENFRISAQDIKLATSLIVLAALWLSTWQKNKRPA